ncbi:helix-turn-helix domain-containing protein [Aquimarina rhabdastrellae]
MNSKELKSIRKELGLTQAELASLIEVSTRTIQGWEYGNQKVTKPIAEFLYRKAEKKKQRTINIHNKEIVMDVSQIETLSLKEMVTFCFENLEEFEKLPIIQMYINYYRNEAKANLLEKHVLSKSNK